MKHYPFISFLFILGLLIINPTFSQNSITVSGKSEFNLSPNEIIIKIAFQEFFKNGEELAENKVPIEEIEDRLLGAISKMDLDKEKITMGGVEIVRPYENRTYLKRRLKKDILICIENTDQYIELIRLLEKEDLFDEIIVEFTITEFRHTQREEYMTKSMEQAFSNAKEKAELILSKSGQKIGRALKIVEVNNRRTVASDVNFYETTESRSQVSGFRPIIVAYEIQVVFEIL